MICCATRRTLASALVALLLASPAAARKDRKGKKVEKEDLINVLLSPGLAQWLVGPIARIASGKEVREYLSLTDDDSANDFIQNFWEIRLDPENPWPGRQVRDIFNKRAEAADRLFTEGANVGRRTDRGSVFILFGPAAKSGFVQDQSRKGITVEVWLYDPAVRIGLHGAPPEERYFFTNKDGLTVVAPPPRILRSSSRRP